jgi:outer membrane PBP1 activator LpoA protein
MRRTVLPIFFSSAVLLSGCSPQKLAPDADGGVRKVAPLLTEAQRRNQSRLSEADDLIRSGNNNKARAVLDAIDVRQLSDGQLAQFDLLYAQLHLSAGNPEKALERLDNIVPQMLSPQNRRNYHQARAFAYSLTDRPLAAAQERIVLAPLLTGAKEQNANQTAIFDALNLLPAAVLQNRNPDTLGGWMALTLLLKHYPQGGAGFEAALLQWRKTHPKHPADVKLLQNYTASAQSGFPPPRNIAVLLPESGPLAQAAQAIKAGFLAAENENHGDKPKIRFYDSEAALPGLLYRQAVTDGAGLIVGPLEKDKLKVLAETTPLTVPVLALNHVPGLTAQNLYQYTLSPIDEAEQAVAKAWSEGYRKALILVPNSDLGKRLAQGYADAWRNHDGIILKTQYFDPKSGDFTRTIEKLLNFDESAGRYRQISELIPGLQFAPRKREDADVVFMTADPAQARALNRQFKTYRLDGVAVYATPHLYGNDPDPVQDEALDGITFCDIPWFFPGAYRDTIDAAALQTPWKQKQSIYLRLLAMGIDAYNLAGRLRQSDKEEYPGATGNLLRLPDGRIRRNLFCARFSNGIPEPLGFTVTPDGIPATIENGGATDNVDENLSPDTP